LDSNIVAEEVEGRKFVNHEDIREGIVVSCCPERELGPGCGSEVRDREGTEADRLLLLGLLLLLDMRLDSRPVVWVVEVEMPDLILWPPCQEYCESCDKRREWVETAGGRPAVTLAIGIEPLLLEVTVESVDVVDE